MEQLKDNATPQSFLKQQAVYLIGLLLLLATALYFLMTINKGDESIYFSNHRSDFASLYFRFATHIGEPYVYVAAAGILAFVKYRYTASIFLVSGLVAGFAVVLKWAFAHPRPYTYFHEVIHQPEAINLVLPIERMNISWTSSFPSGHTTSAFAFYGFLCLISPWRWLQIVWLFLATSVAFSRMYLIQHFLEDVTAGMVAGTVGALIVYAAQPYIKRFSWSEKAFRKTAV